MITFSEFREWLKGEGRAAYEAFAEVSRFDASGKRYGGPTFVTLTMESGVDIAWIPDQDDKYKDRLQWLEARDFALPCFEIIIGDGGACFIQGESWNKIRDAMEYCRKNPQFFFLKLPEDVPGRV